MKFILIFLLILFSCKGKVASKNEELQADTIQLKIEKRDESKNVTKESLSNKEFNQIALECNEIELPSICENTLLGLKLNFDFDNDPNIFAFVKKTYEENVEMPVFFEGLDYKPLLFKSENGNTLFIMLNLIYEYKSIYHCYYYSKDQLKPIGSFEQEAIFDEKDNEIKYIYEIESLENEFSVKIGNGKKLSSLHRLGK